MSRNVKIIFLVTLIILGVIAFMIFRDLSMAPEPEVAIREGIREYREVSIETGEEIIDGRLIEENYFECDQGRYIDMRFLEEKELIEVKLSDGREITLPRTDSPTGDRYANEDESIIIFHRADTIFINEGGEVTFGNCRLEKD